MPSLSSSSVLIANRQLEHSQQQSQYIIPPHSGQFLKYLSLVFSSNSPEQYGQRLYSDSSYTLSQNGHICIIIASHLCYNFECDLNNILFGFMIVTIVCTTNAIITSIGTTTNRTLVFNTIKTTRDTIPHTSFAIVIRTIIHSI